MFCLQFDPVKRELVRKNDDFATTSNPSVQNAAVIWFSRCAFLNNPTLGIGPEDVINSNVSKLTFELNRWKAQVLADGATSANWSSNAKANATTRPDITMEASYE